ncbi:MAG: histidine--tRNA ligase [Candidatus Spechtbacteria bacterium RIFCSPLOWO2_01_FULL_43_12]|uniref:Histidine--tRNA ligase n=1 Tax=Candidatus Spechtbacteria bacterium RIFCSPLOWO2_01_FULL_43_12 TaxID=1802162 RepID=A0A1G2HF32_9BACT|nr:MAG: histidine--tRNA ligase [Candidatus Spechtbacteria bacterium RIFCSPLOWO2_01_FULL_43_12]
MAKKSKQFQTPSGMHDILPSEQYLWQHFYKVAEEISAYYNFQRIDTPVLEFADLFRKGTGQGTDIVAKEMYTLRTRGGDALTLKPEGTPSIVRAYIQHGMKKWTSPVKLYYIAPMFRHDRPQRGRFRQFYQFGLETIGEDDPARDAEILHAFFVIFGRLRLKNVVAEINSIGCSSCRPKYIKTLKEHYRYRLRQVCKDCRGKYKDNPLRLLDCEEEKCARVKTETPHILDYLCVDCNAHFKKVLEMLDSIGIPYLLNPYLVRGLEYYTRTVFEIFEEQISPDVKEGDKVTSTKGPVVKRLAIGSGGRYDNLVKFLGGKDTPAVGGALGMERILEAVARSKNKPLKPAEPGVFIVQLGDAAKKRAFMLFEEFRKARIPVREAFGRESISSQLKLANKFKTNIAVIIGQKEALDKVAIIREMDTGSQETIPQDKLIKEVARRLRNK